MRKVILISGAAIAVIVAVLAILVTTLDVNQFRGTIQAELQKQLNRPVTLGQLSLGFFPLAVRASDVQIGENPAFPTRRPFASVKEIRIRAELLPLLRKKIRVSSLELRQPSIELVSNSAHQWNYADLTSSSGTASGSSLALSELDVVDGSLTVADLAKPGSGTVYDHIDVSLSGFAPGKVFHVKASAGLPRAKADSIVLEGSGGPVKSGELPFNGRLSLNDAPFAALARFAGAALPADGLLSGSADIHSAGSTTNVRGKLALSHASFRGAPLAIPITMDYDIATDSNSGVLEARSARITAGHVLLDASARINSKLNTITASARTTNANVADLLTLARALGLAKMTGSGTMSLNASAAGPLDGDLNYSGSASIPDAHISAGPSSGALAIRNGSIRFNGRTAGLAAEMLSSQGLVLNNMRSTAAFNRGIITLSPVSAQLFGGSAAGAITVDTNPEPQALTLNIRLEGVDANQLLSASTSVKNTMYGALAASMNLKLRLYSATDALTRSINGPLSLNLTKGHLAGVNIMNELASIGKFVGYSLNTQNITTIVKLAGDLAITNGVASTNNLHLQMEGGSLVATGLMNLADQTLNLKTTAVIDRNTSQRVGGNRIGGYLQTALANTNGELVIPATVTGSIAHPHFTPDLEQMAQMKLKNILPTASSPGKLLNNLIGGGSKQQQSPQQPLENAVGNALDSLFRKKTK